jgi:hypothetical protein
MRIRVDNPGQVGLITDLSKAELPNNAWTKVQNIRFDHGYARNAPGFELVFTPADTATYLLGVDVGGTYYLVYPTASAIYSLTGSTETDISRATGYSTTAEWNGCVLSGVVILNNYSECPQYWGGTGDCVDLPYAGANSWDNYDGAAGSYRAKVIRSFRNFLFALGIEEGGTEYPYMVHWSDAADPGTVPASWDYTDPTNLSGRFDLADTKGFVVDALPLRDSLVIYKEDSVWLCSYVGGQYQFRFDIFGEAMGLGIYGQDCVVDIGDKHIVIGNNAIYMHDGVSVKNILRGKAAEALFAAIDPINYRLTHLVHNADRTEVWVCYPPLDATACTRAYVYNYMEGTWSWRTIPASYYASPQLIAETDLASWPSAGSTDSWDLDTSKSWDARNYNPTAATVVHTGAKLLKQSDSSLNQGNPYTCWLERTGLRLGEGGQISLIRDVYPRIVGGPVQVQVGSQLTPDGVVTWDKAQTFDPETDTKVDVLRSGLYHAIRFKTTTGANWRLDGYELDIDSVGAY